MADYTIEPPASPYTIEPPKAQASSYTIEPPKAEASLYKVEPPAAPAPIAAAVKETPSAPLPEGTKPVKEKPAKEPNALERIGKEIVKGLPEPEELRDTSLLNPMKPLKAIAGLTQATINAGASAIAEVLKKTGMEANSADRLARDIEASPEAFAGMIGGAKVPRLAKEAETPKIAPEAVKEAPKPEGMPAPKDSPAITTAAQKAAGNVIDKVDDSIKMPKVTGETVLPAELKESIPSGPGDPKVPEIKGFVRDTEDRLYAIQKSGTADKAEMGNKLKALPKEALDPARQERIYHAMEEEATDKLASDDKAVYERDVEPINAEEDRIYAKLRNAGVVLPREGYVHRIVQGKAPRFDPRDPETAQSDVIAGSKLPRTTGSLRDRVYLSLDDGKGDRKLIATSKDGATVLEGGKATPYPRLQGVKPGDDVTIDGKNYTVGQARTKEIEANTDTKYYKNALTNSIDNVLALRRVERAVDFLDEFKKDPRFLEHAEKVGGNRPPTPGWIATKLPQMEGWRMDPKVAHALDDFYGQRDQGWEWLNKANRFLTTSMFVDPVPHLHNVATHWYVARGWDNFTPARWKGSAKNAARAISQVIDQGPEYQKFLREGGGLLYGDVANRNFYELMLKTMGQQIVKDPARWGSLAKTLGLNRPADLVAALYRASSKALWAGNDMFMLQRYYDLLDKGMSAKEAIADAERHIPNYRIPSEVLNSRGASVFLRQPLVFNFGRYRYGQLKSYFNMVRDLTKNDPKGARTEALGNLAALGVLGILIYPVADAALQQLTGNKDTKLRRAGPAGIAQNVADLTTGEKDFSQALQSLIVPAPASEMLAETVLNRVFFTGKPVLEPADQKRLVAAIESGNVDDMRKYLTRIGTQIAQEGANKLYPAELVTQMLKDEQPDGIRRLAERLVDVQEKTEKQVEGKAKGQIIERREAERRARKTERDLGIPQQ